MTMTAATRPHLDIRAMTDGTVVHGVYGLGNPQLGTTRQGKPFLKCLLRDATGEVPARMWSCDEARFALIETASFVEIRGRCETYQNQVQLILDDIVGVEIDPQEITALLPSSRFDLDEMMADVRAIMGTLVHPAARALADAYLEDEVMMTRFRVAPAAVSVHHAWIGGLLEHTRQLLTLADRMLPLYPELNRDVVLLGLFLHDLGKTAELTWEQGFSYTTDGQLVGHIVRGAIWLQIKAAHAAKRAGVERLPAEFVRVLQHIILSHHALPEYGAAKVPSTPEAIFVAHLDALDAKTAIAVTQVDRGGSGIRQGTFTDRVWALDTRLFRPDPLEGEDASG